MKQYVINMTGVNIDKRKIIVKKVTAYVNSENISKPVTYIWNSSAIFLDHKTCNRKIDTCTKTKETKPKKPITTVSGKPAVT